MTINRRLHAMTGETAFEVVMVDAGAGSRATLIEQHRLDAGEQLGSMMGL